LLAHLIRGLELLDIRLVILDQASYAIHNSVARTSVVLLS
jgi:hypothetical protein